MIPPFLGEFYLLEALDLDKDLITLAVSTDQGSLIELVSRLGPSGNFLAFKISAHGGHIEFETAPTHLASATLN